jgi:hypothetical protein
MRVILASGCVVLACSGLVGCSVGMRVPTASVVKPPASRLSSSVAASPSSSRHHWFGTCRATDLDVAHVAGEGSGGQEYSVIALRNVGRRSCTLDGWPIVRLFDHALQPIGGRAGHHAYDVPTLVRLAPGQRAGVTISVGSVSVPTAAYCRRKVTSTIAITLPGGVDLTVPAVIAVCSRVTGLSTGPVRRGTAVDL